MQKRLEIKIGVSLWQEIKFGSKPTAFLRKLNNGKKPDNQPPRTKKYYRSTKSGAGMTKAGVAKYRRDNPEVNLKTAVTGKVKKGSKDAKVGNHIVLDLQDK